MVKQKSKPKPKPEWMKEDNNGNILFFVNGIIYLRLKSEKRDRNLGHIDYTNKAIHMKRTQEHVHYKSMSYGFNYSLLQEANVCKHIYLSCPHGKYKIPIKDIMSTGEFLFFKQQGFEKQIFMKINVLPQYITTDF